MDRCGTYKSRSFGLHLVVVIGRSRCRAEEPETAASQVRSISRRTVPLAKKGVAKESILRRRFWQTLSALAADIAARCARATALEEFRRWSMVLSVERKGADAWVDDVECVGFIASQRYVGDVIGCRLTMGCLVSSLFHQVTHTFTECLTTAAILILFF